MPTNWNQQDFLYHAVPTFLVNTFDIYQRKIIIELSETGNTPYGLDTNQFIDEFVASITPAFKADINIWPQYDIRYQKKDFKRFFRNKVRWLNSKWGDIAPTIPDHADHEE